MFDGALTRGNFPSLSGAYPSPLVEFSIPCGAVSPAVFDGALIAGRSPAVVAVVDCAVAGLSFEGVRHSAFVSAFALTADSLLSSPRADGGGNDTATAERRDCASSSRSAFWGVSPFPLTPWGRGTIGGEGLLFSSFLSARDRTFFGCALSLAAAASAVGASSCVVVSERVSALSASFSVSSGNRSAVSSAAAAVSSPERVSSLSASSVVSSGHVSAVSVVRRELFLSRRCRSALLRFDRARGRAAATSRRASAVKVPCSRSRRKSPKSSTTRRTRAGSSCSS